MQNKYIGLLIFVIFIIIGIALFTFFKIKWGIADRAQKREQAKRVEDEKVKEKDTYNRQNQ